MSSKKHRRLLFYTPGPDGELVWPEPSLEIVSEDGRTLSSARGPNADTELRIILAIMIDPRWRDPDEHDQVALDLIEALLPEDGISAVEKEATRLLFSQFAQRLDEIPDIKVPKPLLELIDLHRAEIPRNTAANDARAAVKMFRKGKAGKKETRILDPVAEVAGLFTTDGRSPSEEEWHAGVLKLVCSLFERPPGSRIDPATMPMALVRLYFSLTQAAREPSEHFLNHEHHGLQRTGDCPTCELANTAVKHAKAATASARKKKWPQAGIALAQMGLALGTLSAQREEFRTVIGMDRIRISKEHGRKKASAQRKEAAKQIEWTKKYVAKNSDLMKREIDERISLHFGIPLPTAKRRRLEAEKK